MKYQVKYLNARSSEIFSAAHPVGNLHLQPPPTMWPRMGWGGGERKEDWVGNRPKMRHRGWASLQIQVPPLCSHCEIKCESKLRWEWTRNGGIWGVRPAQNSIRQKFIFDKIFQPQFLFHWTKDSQRKQKLVILDKTLNKKYCGFINIVLNSDIQDHYRKIVFIVSSAQMTWMNPIAKKLKTIRKMLKYTWSQVGSKWQLGRFGEFETQCEGLKPCTCTAFGEVSWLSGFDSLYSLVGKVD